MKLDNSDIPNRLLAFNLFYMGMKDYDFAYNQVLQQLSNDSAQKVFNDDIYGFKNKDNYYKWVLATADHLS